MRRILIACILVGVFACDGKKKPSASEIADVLSNVEIEEPAISDEVIGEFIQQIPSPLEISYLLKESEAKYDKAHLNDPNNVTKYNSNFKRALNLGIYGTDMGYTNIYEQNQDALLYLNAIKKLADDLSIGQFFDINTIKRLATASSNLDSLLLITTKNFNSINSFLQGQKRSSLSVLLLTGGWLEALHILCSVAEKNPSNAQLKETIGEQKIIMENVALLLSFYVESDPNIRQLSEDLEELKAAFEEIEIRRVYREPTYTVVNGMLVIQDNSSSEVLITDENVVNIREVTKKIRKQIIN
jgi:hypothetical protein